MSTATPDITVDQFYIENDLRVLEIPTGKKYPSEPGWQTINRDVAEVNAALASGDYDKYGWILDDDHLVVDIDVHGQVNGYESLKKLESDVGLSFDEICGAICDTPSGGRHYYFTKPANIELGKQFPQYPGIDFLAGGGGKGRQVVAAGSSHDDHPGKVYRMHGDRTLREIPLTVIRHL